MSNKTYIIFFDHDGVFAQWDTWSNTTFLKDSNNDVRDLDIYKLNRLDKLMRRIHSDYKVLGISISSWKYVFEEQENINWLVNAANLQRINLTYVDIPKHLSYREPGIRIDVIKNL